MFGRRGPGLVRAAATTAVVAGTAGAVRHRQEQRYARQDQEAYDQAMVSDLSEQVKDHAEQQGYVFPGPVSITLESADDLSTGRFRIRSQAQAQVRSNATNTQVRRARALVEVNGTQQPLHPPAMVVGRGTEADVRINDPGVSRRHIEFGVEPHPDGIRVSVHDLGSINGMLVDGYRVSSTGVHDGSMVKIGNTTMTVRILEEPDQ